MSIFIDSGKINEIRKYMEFGILRGVTTNPSILVKDGITGGLEGIKRACVEIAKAIAPYPLSIELTTNDPVLMIREAKEFVSWAPNINVKVTIHGPNGELDNLRIIHELEHKHNIKVNVTAMMSAQQCLLAAMAGATYVSLFCGRVNNMGYNSIEELKKLRRLLDRFELKAKIICGSTREVLNVIEWLDAGADIVTTVPSLVDGMLIHPYSKETVKMFLDDAKKLMGN